MRRILVSAFLFAFLGFGVLAASGSAQGDLDCPDFGGDQAAAQEYFLEGGGSPSFNFNRLDGDGNGIACEEPGSGTGGGSGSGAVEDTDDVAVEEDDSADVAVEADDTAADTDTDTDTDTDSAAVTEDLPATGSGPLASSPSSSAMLSLLAVGALLFAAVGARVRSSVQR